MVQASVLVLAHETMGMVLKQLILNTYSALGEHASYSYQLKSFTSSTIKHSSAFVHTRSCGWASMAR
jgi:hypothetical protein